MNWNISKEFVLKKMENIFSYMINAICKIWACHSDPHNLKIIHIFKNPQQIFMFKVFISITFCEKCDKTNHFFT